MGIFVLWLLTGFLGLSAGGAGETEFMTASLCLFGCVSTLNDAQGDQ